MSARLRILLDIDGTIASWETVSAHGFGPGTRPYDLRVHALIAAHAVTLFSQNPEIGAWAEKLGCAWLIKPAPGSPALELGDFDVLIDDWADQFAYHCPTVTCFLSLDDFFRAHPL